MIYDCIIIGSGISGSATAFYLSQYNINAIVLEKSNEVASGTTKANSAVMHAGYDAREGSNKAKYNVLSQKLLPIVTDQLDIPYKKVGSYVLDFTNSDALDVLCKRSQANGVKNIKIVSGEEILKNNPDINPKVKRGLYAKDTGVIDPFLFNVRLAENAKMNGINFFFNEKVIDIIKNEDHFLVLTEGKWYKTKTIINAAGLYADEINNIVSKTKYTITPVKGEYFLLDRKDSKHINHVFFQLPSETTKGVLVQKTIDGNGLIGPNAILVTDKNDTSVSSKTLNEVYETAKLTMPNLSVKNAIATFAGLRATLKETDDFVIGEAPDVPGFFNLLGINSPGLTSCLGFGADISKQVAKRLKADKKPKSEINYIVHIKHFNLLKSNVKRQLVKQNPDYGKVVCNCEKVTLAEIKQAINSVIPATSLDELKHRTRAGAGRCQAGFCQNDLVKILAEEQNISPLEVTKNGGKSIILKEKIK